MAIKKDILGGKDELGREVLEIIPYKGMRKSIGDKLFYTRDNTAQSTGYLTIDTTELITYRARKKEEGIRLSFSAMYARASALAARDLPIINSERIEDKILIYNNINIGVTLYVDDMLVIPVIVDADEKDARQITNELDEAVSLLRNGKYFDVKMSGSTMSINNLGNGPIDFGSSYLNGSQASMIMFGASKKVFVPDDKGMPVLRVMTGVSMTTDHSIVDGVPKSRYLSRLIEIVADPESYMLF